MGRYADWTPQEVWDKADWEGGVGGLLDWGGADAFEGLGPDAYAAAQSVESHFRFLQRALDAAEPEE